MFVFLKLRACLTFSLICLFFWLERRADKGHSGQKRKNSTTKLININAILSIAGTRRGRSNKKRKVERVSQPNMTEQQEVAGGVPRNAKEKKSKSSSSSKNQTKNKKNSTGFLKLLGKKLLHDLEQKKKYKIGYGGRKPKVSCNCTTDGSACPCGDDDGDNQVAVTTIQGTTTGVDVVEVVKDEETLLYVPKEDGVTNCNNLNDQYGHNVSGTPLGYAPDAPPPSDFSAGATSWFEHNTDTAMNTNIATTTITVNPDGVLTNSSATQREEAVLMDANGINWNDI